MICPVCKTEFNNNDMCPICGFDQLDVEFLNRDDADEWVKNEVMTYRTNYCKKFNLCNSEYQIKNGVLVKYTGKGQSVNIPFGVSEIGERAFQGCASLEKVMIPNSVRCIESFAFAECNSLISITIPTSVISIESGAFISCESLSLVVLENENTHLGCAAFSDCPSLADSDGFVIVCGILFDYFGNEPEIIIPSRVSEIDSEAFCRCDEDEVSVIWIPSSVHFINDWPFMWLEDIQIWSSMGSYAEKYAKENNIPFRVVE